MDYNKYLADEQFMLELPRNIVVMRSSDGNHKILHVNNQLLNKLNIDGSDGQLNKAIDLYFQSHEETLVAEIYTLISNKKKKLIGTIDNPY